MTRGYEALVILKSAGTEQDLARHAAQVEEQIKKSGGRIEGSQNMGRRRLAFRISRQSEGYYYCWRFQGESLQVAELERVLRLNESIVRFIILSADGAPVPTPAAPRPAASGTGQPAAVGRGAS